MTVASELSATNPNRVFRYRVLRYMPNVVRDEWVNIGVVLEEAGDRAAAGMAAPVTRRAIRVIEDETEIVRLRRIHPSVDENLLRQLAAELESGLRGAGPLPAALIERLDRTLSNAIQFGPHVGLLAADFDAALDRLYREQVERPPSERAGILENTRSWIRARLNDVFGRHRLLSKLERGVRVEEFTQRGDPMRLDYAYRANGARGYLQAVVLGRDPAPAKLFAYTAARIRAIAKGSEFTAVTDEDFSAANPRHNFVARLFAGEQIAVVPLNRIETFTSSLKTRLN
jgi:Protein of unknown function (DUF3037)